MVTSATEESPFTQLKAATEKNSLRMELDGNEIWEVNGNSFFQAKKSRIRITGIN
jgi:hypothetical protein